jgi:high-affinity iron transporter
MKSNKYKNLLAGLAVFLFSVFSTATENSPRTIVHLLDYLAKDYGGAVQNGKVISKDEYHEQVEFSDTAVEVAKNIPEIKSNKKISGALDKLHDLIAHKASPEQVASLAQSIRKDVIVVTKLEVAPTQWPSLARGRELFANNCASCHGMKGLGDGPAGAGLDPKPANFHGKERMGQLSPFQAFNTIRLGVNGTGMAPSPYLPEKDVWALAFYVVSLRHENGADAKQATEEIHKAAETVLNKVTLTQAATSSDENLKKQLDVPEEEKSVMIAQVRLHSGDDEGGGSLSLARTNLDRAVEDYKSGDKAGAKNKALLAYLEGVEPIEPKLKATDPGALVVLEEKMAAVRATIEAQKPLSDLQLVVSLAKEQIQKADVVINQKNSSPLVTFLVASAIILREGFEAVLILIALLGVIRAAGSKKAAHWVHAGWVVALLLGVVAWIFSGWLMNISGAQREMLEGSISLLAVVILLYMGFWLHSRTEMSRWHEFINGQVQSVLDGGNLYGLFGISFMAVFREVFETVLFLRALWLEGGTATKTALFSGIGGSLLLLFVLSWALLKYSAGIPIRKLFAYSSTLMALLAVILAGKGMHALQETGLVSITTSPLNLRIDLLGLYPTLETTIAQAVALLLTISLWLYGNRPTHKKAAYSNRSC